MSVSPASSPARGRSHSARAPRALLSGGGPAPPGKGPRASIAPNAEPPPSSRLPCPQCRHPCPAGASHCMRQFGGPREGRAAPDRGRRSLAEIPPHFPGAAACRNNPRRRRIPRRRPSVPADSFPLTSPRSAPLPSPLFSLSSPLPFLGLKLN